MQNLCDSHWCFEFYEGPEQSPRPHLCPACQAGSPTLLPSPPPEPRGSLLCVTLGCYEPVYNNQGSMCQMHTAMQSTKDILPPPPLLPELEVDSLCFSVGCFQPVRHFGSFCQVHTPAPMVRHPILPHHESQLLEQRRIDPASQQVQALFQHTTPAHSYAASNVQPICNAVACFEKVRTWGSLCKTHIPSCRIPQPLQQQQNIVLPHIVKEQNDVLSDSEEVVCVICARPTPTGPICDSCCEPNIKTPPPLTQFYQAIAGKIPNFEMFWQLNSKNIKKFSPIVKYQLLQAGLDGGGWGSKSIIKRTLVTTLTEFRHWHDILKRFDKLKDLKLKGQQCYALLHSGLRVCNKTIIKNLTQKTYWTAITSHLNRGQNQYIQDQRHYQLLCAAFKSRAHTIINILIQNPHWSSISRYLNHGQAQNKKDQRHYQLVCAALMLRNVSLANILTTAPHWPAALRHLEQEQAQNKKYQQYYAFLRAAFKGRNNIFIRKLEHSDIAKFFMGQTINGESIIDGSINNPKNQINITEESSLLESLQTLRLADSNGNSSWLPRYLNLIPNNRRHVINKFIQNNSIENTNNAWPRQINIFRAAANRK